METILTWVTAAVVFIYIVSLLKKNTEWQFWSLIAGIGCIMAGTVYDFSTESSFWIYVWDYVILGTWIWLAIEAHKELQEEKKKNDSVPEV